MKNYSQDELNQILLSKNLDDFYIAVVQRKPVMMTDDELNFINRNRRDYNGATAKVGEKVINFFYNTKFFNKAATTVDKLLLSSSRIRFVGLLTFIDGQVYDAANRKFLDLDRYKITYYDCFTTYYNNDNARVKIFTPAEVDNLTENTALIDVDDESIINYFYKIIGKLPSTDFTEQFLDEAKEKQPSVKTK